MHSEFEYHVAYQFSGLSTVAYKRVAYKKMSVGPQLEYQKTLKNCFNFVNIC